MPPFLLAICICVAGTFPFAALSQTDQASPPALGLELNTANDTGAACRLTFVATNQTGADIEQAIFETVIFDTSGSVISLSLFDFRDLPFDRPRVRQFDVAGITCDSIGQALINGTSTCTVNGSESPVCRDALSLKSRIEVDLLG